MSPALGEGRCSLSPWGFVLAFSWFVLAASSPESTQPPWRASPRLLCPQPALPSTPLILTGWGRAAPLPSGQRSVGGFHLLQIYFLWVAVCVVAHSLAQFLGASSIYLLGERAFGGL